MPTPHSETAPGIESPRLPILVESSFSNNPCSQPSSRVRDSTWITSQTVLPVFAIFSSSVVCPSYEKDSDVNAGRLAEGTVVRLGERRLIGASKRDDRNVVCVDGVEFSQQEADKNYECNIAATP